MRHICLLYIGLSAHLANKHIPISDGDCKSHIKPRAAWLPHVMVAKVLQVNIFFELPMEHLSQFRMPWVALQCEHHTPTVQRMYKTVFTKPAADYLSTEGITHWKCRHVELSVSLFIYMNTLMSQLRWLPTMVDAHCDLLLVCRWFKDWPQDWVFSWVYKHTRLQLLYWEWNF